MNLSDSTPVRRGMKVQQKVGPVPGNGEFQVEWRLLLVGLLTSEIYHRHGHSQRLGLALGLVVIGLFLTLRFYEVNGFEISGGRKLKLDVDLKTSALPCK